MGFRHLHQGIILLVEENLDPLNISIDPCKIHQQRRGMVTCELKTSGFHLQLIYVVILVSSVGQGVQREQYEHVYTFDVTPPWCSG